MNDKRVYRSADIGSDHYLVCTKIQLRLRKAPKEKVECRVKYNTAKLENEQVLKAFNITLTNRYEALENKEPEVEKEEEVKRDFQVMKKAYIEAAETVLGRPQKTKKPWIGKESCMGPHRSKRGR